MDQQDADLEFLENFARAVLRVKDEYKIMEKMLAEADKTIKELKEKVNAQAAECSLLLYTDASGGFSVVVKNIQRYADVLKLAKCMIEHVSSVESIVARTTMFKSDSAQISPKSYSNVSIDVVEALALTEALFRKPKRIEIVVEYFYEGRHPDFLTVMRDKCIKQEVFMPCGIVSATVDTYTDSAFGQIESYYEECKASI